MDGTRGIYRRALWLPCVLCVVFGLSTVQAATRKHVSMPTAQSVASNPSGQVTRTGNSLFVPGQPLEGEFIPGVDGKKIPVRGILPTIDFSIPRTLTQGKNLLKGGVIGAGVSLGIDWMLSQIGAFIDENSGAPMKNGKKSVPASSLYWCHVNSDTHCNNSAPDRMRLSTPTDFPDMYKVWQPGIEICSATYSIQNNGTQVLIKFNTHNPGQCILGPAASSQITYYRRGTCPAPSFFDAELMSCVENAPVPLEDPDYDLMFNAANSQNAAWLKGLLKDVCAASPSPARCFEEMKQNSALNGPASVPGGTTTQTTNSVSPSGVSTQTVTTTKNTYNFTYGPTYYDYRKTTQIITTENGEPKSDTTIEEPVEPEQEEKPPEEEQEEPVLCSGQGCDGPAYEDQYTPLEETKENYLDDYASRVAAIPIIQAVGGLFDVSVSGSCPVWTFDHQLQILGASVSINLTFDYLCLPWFVQYGPWIRAIIYLVAVYGAIRIALL